MTMSSPAAPGPSGFIPEPPLSPGTAPISPAPAPMSQLPSRPTTPSIEAQVVRLGLMTPDQVATAMREEAETGRTFDEIVIGHGWLSADDLGRLREPDAPASAPTPTPAPVEPPVALVPPVTAEPEPAPIAVVSEPEPEPVATAEPFAPPAVEIAPDPVPTIAAAPPATTSARVFVRLAGGERVDAGSFESEGEAERRARELMRLLDAGGDWPQLDGRYIRPDAIVSIDVDASI